MQSSIGNYISVRVIAFSRNPEMATSKRIEREVECQMGNVNRIWRERESALEK